jgi:hypothetical protein
VVFNDYPDSNPVFIAWLAEQSRQYDLHRVLPYNVSTLEPRPGPTQNQVYIVYEFVPKADPAVARKPSGAVLR